MILNNENIKKITVLATDSNSCDRIDFYKGDEIVISQTSVVFDEIQTHTTKMNENSSLNFVMTANGETIYAEDPEVIDTEKSNRITLKFKTYKKQLLTGLGQYEDGVYDYTGKKEYLYQSNMRNAMPILISSLGYAVYVDSQSDIIFEEKNGDISFIVGAGEEITYYIIIGENTDDIIASIRDLTGTASMLPRWCFGYWQSKERYDNAEELLSVAENFRELKIPIDCIVQDWHTWIKGRWGNKIPDKERYPNLPDTIKRLHDNNIKLLWSIWPNMHVLSDNYIEFKKHDLIMGSSQVYDAYSEQGRKLYSEQSNRELLCAGLDGWWCDSTEPFSNADWGGEHKKSEHERYLSVIEESRNHLPWDKVNSYCLYHAMGVYENFLQNTEGKRCVNLTRSVYVGAQKYGTIMWSGDICARWDVLKNQITEGLKFVLSGHPYWTIDIGAFFVVKDKYENRGCNNEGKEPLWFWNGDYNDGVLDAGYCELYTRWLQYATFLPVFRSHGTDTPREPWQFKNKKLDCYDTIISFIKIRYRILPYIYSLAYRTYAENYTMLRSFLFDFAYDETAINISNSFMFGDAFLVKPIVKPMYFESNNKEIIDRDFTQSIYLPKGFLWYDYFTNICYEGGSNVELPYSIDVFPVFVKAGSIIPTNTNDVEYSAQNNNEYNEVVVYEGADGEFCYYNDSGDGFGFEDDEFVRYSFTYSDAMKTLTLSQNTGKLPVNKIFNVKFVRQNGEQYCKSFNYNGENTTYTL